jgi:hypothetical protein
VPRTPLCLPSADSRVDTQPRFQPPLPTSRNSRTRLFQSRYTRCNECRATEANVYVRFWHGLSTWASGLNWAAACDARAVQIEGVT